MEPEVSEKLKTRFMSCAEGDDEDSARLKRENLRSVLECTDAWTCLAALHGFPIAKMFDSVHLKDSIIIHNNTI